MTDALAQDILDYAGPRRKSYAVLRVRGRGGSPPLPPFRVGLIASIEEDRDFGCVEDALNHLHSLGYALLPDEENDRWGILFRGGVGFDDVGRHQTVYNVLATFARTDDSPSSGHTLLTAGNLASAVADVASAEADRLISRPRISVVSKLAAADELMNAMGFVGDDQPVLMYSVHGLDEQTGNPEIPDMELGLEIRYRFADIESSIASLLEAGFQRMDKAQEDEWKGFITRMNQWVGPTGEYHVRAGNVLAVFAK